jgi:4a-hydroxytetrahydrobiopterin dehydratase
VSLAQKKCLPCEGGVQALAAGDAKALSSQVPKWKVTLEPPRVSREFKFKDFAEAMKFTNQVAKLAEKEGHHPDFHIHWNRVELVLWTHALGGLSENDFIMAAKIDKLA